MPRSISCKLPLALLGALLSLRAAAGDAAITFNRDIRPILTQNCYPCHGPDKGQRKAKLRLDAREVALERGAIAPGKPEDSKLIDHIFATDPDDTMPPPKTGKKLTEAQKDLLKKWIAAGAKYEPHWAYIRPERPTVPAMKDRRWVRNPIDAFILHTLEEKGIRPSPEADKATLLRRLSLDLIGLPPTPEQVRAFVRDRSATAYEREVDRLLNSPHFGERMAVPWLDIVRFADTVGYHGDQNQRIFPYRDYVIDAFNRDKPFDQFTLEQLAGDLMPNPTTESRIASGFNRLNMVTREGGAQPKEYLAKYAADRVRTVSMAWLGSTMGCAECHDHKFDPFASKDFYQMEAFFADIKQWGVYSDYDYTPNPDLKGFDNDHPFPPEIEVESPYLERRLTRLHAEADQLYDRFAAHLEANAKTNEALAAWKRESLRFLQQWPTGWAVPIPEISPQMKDTNAPSGTNYSVAEDGTVRFSDRPKRRVRFTLPLPEEWISAIRLEIEPRSTEDDGSRKRVPASIAPVARLKRAENDEDGARLRFYFGEADHKTERYSNGFSIIGVTDQWKISTGDDRQTAVWILDRPVKVAAGDRLLVDLGELPVASARLAVTPFAAPEALAAGMGEKLRQVLWRPRARTDHRLGERAYLLGTGWDTNLLALDRKNQDLVRECRQGRAFTLVTVAREPLVTRVLPRGNWQSEDGEIVQPQAPHFLPQIPNPEGRRLTRLDLAHWLVSPENPLTARAVMNRLWKQFFGTGISAVVDDLGAQGEWPVHPELLDWLACEFMKPEWAPARRGPPATAWDFKHMVKLLVMSSTYRQSATQRPDLKEVDPNNRLLACQSPRRLEAEFIRDNALFIAGLLNDDIGGPSVFPYQPSGYYIYLQFPDRDYYASAGDRQYRRGLYTHWQRTFLHPMLANFDAPSREECTANRVVSNTPQQALTLLNDPTFVEAARAFAARLLATGPQPDSRRLDQAYERALARTATEPERRSLLQFLQLQRDHYRQAPEDTQKLLRVGNSPAADLKDKAEAAAWTQVCRVLLNLHETITCY